MSKFPIHYDHSIISYRSYLLNYKSQNCRNVVQNPLQNISYKKKIARDLKNFERTYLKNFKSIFHTFQNIVQFFRPKINWLFFSGGGEGIGEGVGWICISLTKNYHFFNQVNIFCPEFMMNPNGLHDHKFIFLLAAIGDKEYVSCITLW